MVLALVSAAISALCALRLLLPGGGGCSTGQARSPSPIGLFALLFFPVDQVSTAGWGSTQVIVGFIVAVVFVVALFLAIEHRSRSPLLRLGLFRNRRLR